MVELKELYINGVDRAAEAIGFANTIGLSRVAAGRYSNIFLAELFCYASGGDIEPSMVMDEIKYLEGCGERTGSKAPSQFTRNVLSGLWHKHYREIGLRSMAMNLQPALREYGIPSLQAALKEVEETGQERLVTRDDIQQFVQDVVEGNYGRRWDAGKLTGEWIIYAKHEGKNYYLCLGKHDSGDDMLRQKIEHFCVVDFPFLADILKA